MLFSVAQSLLRDYKKTHLVRARSYTLTNFALLLTGACALFPSVKAKSDSVPTNHLITQVNAALMAGAHTR
jgi:hypothetical protein